MHHSYFECVYPWRKEHLQMPQVSSLASHFHTATPDHDLVKHFHSKYQIQQYGIFEQGFSFLPDGHFKSGFTSPLLPFPWPPVLLLPLLVHIHQGQCIPIYLLSEIVNVSPFQRPHNSLSENLREIMYIQKVWHVGTVDL